MTSSYNELMAVALRPKVANCFYYSQQLLSGNTIVALFARIHFRVIAHHTFLATMDLEQDSPNTNLISICIKFKLFSII